MSMQATLPEREEAVIINGYRKGQIIEINDPSTDWTPVALSLLDRVVLAAKELAAEAIATRSTLESLRAADQSENGE